MSLQTSCLALRRPQDRLHPIVLGTLLGVATAALLWATIVIHFGLANCFWL